MPKPFSTRAPAKINLTLHVLGRREDGYHALESLVAFAGTGDDLTLDPSKPLGLAVSGLTAQAAGEGADNLVLKAARLLAERVPGLRMGGFHLVKRLPVAAGIGGGSSDAAAALRLLARLNSLPLDSEPVREAARLTGADVPVCLHPVARMMRGIGDEIGPPLRLPPLFSVLVNPRVPVATPSIFRAMNLAPGEALDGSAHPSIKLSSSQTLIASLRDARNDLQNPSCAIEPVVNEALRLVGGTDGCRLVRMSGSGATVFGLYDDCDRAAEAAKMLRRSRPDWWVKPTRLR
jgi:4-diphosphocytidyl-2-C-methyl-D-erythritol kinase